MDATAARFYSAPASLPAVLGFQPIPNYRNTNNSNSPLVYFSPLSRSHESVNQESLFRIRFVNVHNSVKEKGLQSSNFTCYGGRGSFSSFEDFGPYPWDPSWQNPEDNDIEWFQQETITLFTSDGLVQIGGSLVPRQSSTVERRQPHERSYFRSRRFKEEDYMDPKQGLCLGAIFDIVATNGLDTGRKFCVFGFCRSIEMLSDVVEDTVVGHGGEVVLAEKRTSGGLNEKLSMTVAVPFLWGVPPAVDTLNYAIRCGGGIVEKVSCEWEFL